MRYRPPFLIGINIIMEYPIDPTLLLMRTYIVLKVGDVLAASKEDTDHLIMFLWMHYVCSHPDTTVPNQGYVLLTVMHMLGLRGRRQEV